jgi:hypothetical protein
MQSKYKIGFVVAACLSLFLWGRCSHEPPVVPTPLPPGVIGQVIVNPQNHTITVTTPDGTHTTTLPYQPTPINIGPDGQITMKAKQFGLELHPFGGIGFDGYKAAILGLDVLYFKRLDLGLAGLYSNNALRPVLSLSYNVWSNIRVTGTLSQLGMPGVFATVRF